MIFTIFRRVVTCCIAFTAFAITVMAQTATVTHTIDRGETLESIAERYGVTKAAIIEVNPAAAQFVYVGMELVIPVKTVAVSDNGGNKVSHPASGAKQSNVDAPMAQATNYVQQGNVNATTYMASSSDWNPLWKLGARFDFSFLTNPEGTDGFSWGLGIYFAGNYYFTRNFYGGLGLGYDLKNPIQKISSETFKTEYDRKYHFICLPIEVGAMFPVGSGSTELGAFLGMDFNMCVAGKADISKQEKKYFTGSKTQYESWGAVEKAGGSIKGVGGKLGMELNIGARVNVGGFTIGGKYVIPVNDNQKAFNGNDNGYFAIVIGNSI